MDFERRFGGIARLYGQAGLARFQAAHVCVVGVGGVGSWIVEALARSAIGKLTLIDLDNVAESNINRQIQAMSSTLGKAKIAALAERMHMAIDGGHGIELGALDAEQLKMDRQKIFSDDVEARARQ